MLSTTWNAFEWINSSSKTSRERRVLIVVSLYISTSILLQYNIIASHCNSTLGVTGNTSQLAFPKPGVDAKIEWAAGNTVQSNTTLDRGLWGDPTAMTLSAIGIGWREAKTRVSTWLTSECSARVFGQRFPLYPDFRRRPQQGRFLEVQRGSPSLSDHCNAGLQSVAPPYPPEIRRGAFHCAW